jgi:hypothetical protein
VTGSVNNDDLYLLRVNVGAYLDKLDLGAVTVEGKYFADNALRDCMFEELILPDGIELIRPSFLEGCIYLKTIDIPNSVKYIGHSILGGATALETVTGGNGVIDFVDCRNGGYFMNCPNLKHAVIMGNIFLQLPLSTVGAYEVPEGVTTFARHALADVTGLTALTLPEDATIFYGYQFSSLNNLKDIYFPAVELPGVVDGEAFVSFDRSSCTLHVYEEMVDVFKADENWGLFNIVGDLGPLPNRTPMNEADYAVLCAIYNTLDGNSWKTRWLISKNVQTASRWRGVTFDEDGYVTSINLSDNRLDGDISSLTFSGLTHLTSMNLSSNSLTGDIMPFAESLPNGCRLNVERQELGNIGEHTLYDICKLNQENSGLPNIAFYRSESSTLVSTLIGVGGNCHFYHEGTNGEHYWDGYINADGGTDSWHKFCWPSPTIVECTYPHHFTFTYKYEMGDANMDDALNVLDLQTTLNYSNNQQWGLFNFYAANTYGSDDDINVQDIVSTVNILLALEGDNPAGARAFVAASPKESEAWVSAENGQIVLYTTKPVAALDLRLAGIEPGSLIWNTEDMGFATATVAQTDGTHAIIYSMQQRQIEEGRTVLATFDGSLYPSVISAVLSDSKAQAISVGKGTPTGISQLNDDVFSHWSLSDLSGQRLATGTHASEADIRKMAKSRNLHGVFILNMDGTIRKIIIK